MKESHPEQCLISCERIPRLCTAFANIGNYWSLRFFCQTLLNPAPSTDEDATVSRLEEERLVLLTMTDQKFDPLWS